MKEFSEGVFLAIVIVICGILFLINYEKKHYCDNPYEKICVKSHSAIRTIMMPHRVGNVTTMRPMPVVTRICDEYETRIKEKCKE